jgi:putative oxygen-independent coproporphyrinogen III oxidase
MPVSIVESVDGNSDQAVGVEDAGLGLYVHWPFCVSKCPYCDFNSHVRETIDQERWGRALVGDLEGTLSTTPTDVLRPLTSVFFGGGTPSLMAPEIVAAVLDLLSARGLVGPRTEITLEANPSSADAKRFAAYHDAGVNRLSIGVQALDNEALRFLGRAHDVGEALDAVAAARATFDRVSFDLIYARTGQTPEAWREELERVLALEPAHVSLYQLTIERGTRFHEAQARGDLTVPGEDDAATMYEDTLSRCKETGLVAYEVSNFAHPGEECRHNLVYWRSGDWLGVGPGAHGRLGQGEGRVATRQWRSPEKWLDAVEKTGTGLEASEGLDAPTRATEMLMMGLRLTEGVSAGRFKRMVGKSLQDMLIRDRVDGLVEGGFVEVSQHGVRTTLQGRNVLNTLVSQLLP